MMNIGILFCSSAAPDYNSTGPLEMTFNFILLDGKSSFNLIHDYMDIKLGHHILHDQGEIDLGLNIRLHE